MYQSDCNIGTITDYAILQASAWSLTNGNNFYVPTSGHQKQHEHVFLKLDQEYTRHQKQREVSLLGIRIGKLCLNHWSEVWPLSDWPRMGGRGKGFRRFGDNSGHGAWIRKQFLPRSSVGCPAVVTELSCPRKPSSGSTRLRR